MKIPQLSLMDPNTSRFWSPGYCKWLEDNLRAILDLHDTIDIHAVYKEETQCHST